jgi:nucleoside-diphosphate-sugar epimerase
VLDRLQDSGLELHGLSRSREPGPDGDVHWWRGDVADPDAVAKVFAAVRPDLVFNIAGDTHAARDLHLVRTTFDANLAGTVNVLSSAAAGGCRRVVLTGSLEEPVVGAGAVASSPYAASKWASSLYAEMFHAVFGLSVVTLRVFMVYGPGQHDVAKLVPYTILRLLRNEPPEVTSGTRQVDWIYVDDVAKAFVAAGFAGDVEGTTIDIGSGELRSVREIVERLTQLVAPSVEPLFGAVEDRPSEEVHVADIDAAASRLDWRPETTFDDGLASTVKWFRSRFDAGVYPDAG